MTGSLGCKALLAAAALALFGCYEVEQPYRPDLTSFKVTVKGVYGARPAADGQRVKFGDEGTPLPVVSSCLKRYGGLEAQVPAEVRGQVDCPYAIPHGEVDLDVEVVALDKHAEQLKDFTGPVAFKVVPGDLSAAYPYRWMTLSSGFGQGVVRVSHLYGEVRVWVADQPPEPIYSSGERVQNDDLPREPDSRTHATGVSAVEWFEDPTLASVQITDGFDNTTSPLQGQFLSIGRPPGSGSARVESCPDDPEHDGKQVMMVVTGIDPSGFFVTDLNACRVREVLTDASGATQVRVPEPGGFYPGTWASMFVYNYSFPDGLDEGDLLWSLNGSVQEFTGTTQLTFPSWNIRDHVRQYPQSEWNKYLGQVPIPEVNLRLCGLDDKQAPFVTDVLCAHNRRSLKVESLESALVKLHNVKLSQKFVNCDQNGDGEVPFFCEQKNEQGTWILGDCTAFDGPSTLSDTEKQELACNVDCVAGQGAVCSERSTFASYGQFVIELAGPGPVEAGLDPSLKAKIERIPVGATAVQSQTPFWEGAELRLWCDAPVRYQFGGPDDDATPSSAQLPAKTLLEHVIGPGEPNLSLLLDGDGSGGPICSVALNTHTRINLITKDAVPELKPDCDPDDPDAEAAQQCRNLRGARYDVIGHLHQVQPARPRWVVLPRDKEDLCCYPGPGLQCPRPIEPCP